MVKHSNGKTERNLKWKWKWECEWQKGKGKPWKATHVLDGHDGHDDVDRNEKTNFLPLFFLVLPLLPVCPLSGEWVKGLFIGQLAIKVWNIK